MARRESFKDAETPKYWFPAKSYGWGWGIPNTWQGWAVLLGYIALIIASAIVFPPHEFVGEYLMSVGVLSAVLVGVCYLTGEPPSWRWGRGERD